MRAFVKNEEFENWEVLRRFLPEGWEEQAWLCGAMRRARYIKEPATVLRILLLHLANGCSLAETAARAQTSGLGAISSVGVFKRLRAAGPWLRWLAQQERGAAALPLGAVGRKVRAVDATTVCEPGSTGGDWRVHYAVNLADLQCDFFQLTELRQSGETFRRVPVTRAISCWATVSMRRHPAWPMCSRVVETSSSASTGWPCLCLITIIGGLIWRLRCEP